MTMPNFLIIGAAKAGTTSLWYYLKQHPQVYMGPVKEPNFFSFEGEKLDFHGPSDGLNQVSITYLDAYCAQFQGVSGEKAIGEASSHYLCISRASIQHYIPDAKLIAVLCDPVERAYSSFLHLVRMGREPFSDFSRALREEEKRICNNFRFLNVDDHFVPDMVRYNVSGVPQSKALNTILTRLRPLKYTLEPFLPEGLHRCLLHGAISLKSWNLPKPPLHLEVRRQLIQEYREDILKLQNLLQRDLSKWLE